MTEQIPDRVVYQETEYILEGVDGQGLFDPSDLGVRPTRTSTANWRGFRCTYAVVESRLVLDELRIGLRDPNELHLREPKIFTAEPERAEMQSWRFRDLQYPIDFTGQLTLVKDWIPGYNFHSRNERQAIGPEGAARCNDAAGILTREAAGILTHRSDRLKQSGG